MIFDLISLVLICAHVCNYLCVCLWACKYIGICAHAHMKVTGGLLRGSIPKFIYFLFYGTNYFTEPATDQVRVPLPQPLQQ